MASSPENVKNDLDNATNSQPSPYFLHPPYPPPSSSQPQWLLPAYPSAPPPEYGQVVGSKTYEGSNGTGPYQYTTSEANQPQQMLLLPNVQSRNIPPSPPQQVVFVERNTLRIDRHHSQQSFMTHIILSCCVFWCCGWMCGGIAFIVALIAQSSAASGDVAGARRLGHLSLGLSICGLITGIIVTIVVIVGAAH